MKKENKKMAQERRAAERKKQATMRLVRNTLIMPTKNATISGGAIKNIS